MSQIFGWKHLYTSGSQPKRQNQQAVQCSLQNLVSPGASPSILHQRESDVTQRHRAQSLMIPVTQAEEINAQWVKVLAAQHKDLSLTPEALM